MEKWIGMDSETFREFGKAAIDFVADYTNNLRDYDALPSVEPGYLEKLLPDTMPKKGENWPEILEDFKKNILPGIAHWQSPRFHAYYPTGNSFPSIVGEILSAGLGVIGFSWITSPACTELEVIVMNWLGKLLNLPQQFLSSPEGLGGGVIQGSASETTFLCLLAAKERMVRKMIEEDPSLDDNLLKAKMIAYSSDQSNSSVEKAGLLGSMTMRLLPVDDEGRLTGSILRNAFEKDIAAGLIPTYVCATLGTTGTCSFDRIEEIGPICQQFGVWFHVDAAYAGAAAVCPEYQYILNGIELADSFNFNPHKWLLVNFDLSALWVQNSEWLTNAFNVERIYLQHHREGLNAAPDYRHWQIPLGRRFRALKLWMTLRSYGEDGLQAHIRQSISLAEEFVKLVRSDSRFEIVVKPSLGLVCFRLKGPCEHTKQLLELITRRRKIYVVAATFLGQLCIRFVVASRLSELSDIHFSWNEITSQAEVILNAVYEKRNRSFGVADICEESAKIFAIGNGDRCKNLIA